MTRDVLVNQIPSALTNPAYITVCVIAGFVGYRITFAKGQLFREGLVQLVTCVSLPLNAIVGGAEGRRRRGARSRRAGPRSHRTDRRAMVCGCLLRRPLKRSVLVKWFVSIALLTGIIWVLCDTAGLNTRVSAVIVLMAGYTVRVLALYYACEEPLARGPKGVYVYDDGRPLLPARTQAQGKVSPRDEGSGPHGERVRREHRRK